MYTVSIQVCIYVLLFTSVFMNFSSIFIYINKYAHINNIKFTLIGSKLKQIGKYEDAVNQAVTSQLNQNQFDSLVSFTFNLGGGSLRSSTLLKKVNIDPSDPTIADEFIKWDKAGGKVIQGLLNRRTAESTLYFS